MKIIVIFFVYSDGHNPLISYPSLEEKDLTSPCIVGFDLISSPQSCENDDVYIQIPLEHHQSCKSMDPEIHSPLSTIIVETCNQPVEPHFQPTDVQYRIKEKTFKPLKFPSILHLYPPKFLEFLHLFIGEDHITCEKHLEAFHNFIDNFEIMHEDVVMRLFSKSLVGDVALWFKNMEVDSIGSLD